jgi:DNA transposition AAA+ family ATPase
METVVKSRNTSDTRFIVKSAIPPNTWINKRDAGEQYLVSMIEESCDAKGVKHEEVMEEIEDAMLLMLMEERRNEENVSMDEVLNFLRQ